MSSKRKKRSRRVRNNELISASDTKESTQEMKEIINITDSDPIIIQLPQTKKTKSKKKKKHSKSGKKSKGKSIPIVLNDNSDGEIEDTPMDLNRVLIPIIKTKKSDIETDSKKNKKNKNKKVDKVLYDIDPRKEMTEISDNTLTQDMDALDGDDEILSPAQLEKILNGNGNINHINDIPLQENNENNNNLSQDPLSNAAFFTQIHKQHTDTNDYNISNNNEIDVAMDESAQSDDLLLALGQIGQTEETVKMNKNNKLKKNAHFDYDFMSQITQTAHFPTIDPISSASKVRFSQTPPPISRVPIKSRICSHKSLSTTPNLKKSHKSIANKSKTTSKKRKFKPPRIITNGPFPRTVSPKKHRSNTKINKKTFKIPRMTKFAATARKPITKTNKKISKKTADFDKFLLGMDLDENKNEENGFRFAKIPIQHNDKQEMDVDRNEKPTETSGFVKASHRKSTAKHKNNANKYRSQIRKPSFNKAKYTQMMKKMNTSNTTSKIDEFDTCMQSSFHTAKNKQNSPINCIKPASSHKTPSFHKANKVRNDVISAQHMTVHNKPPATPSFQKANIAENPTISIPSFPKPYNSSFHKANKVKKDVISAQSATVHTKPPETPSFQKANIAENAVISVPPFPKANKIENAAIPTTENAVTSLSQTACSNSAKCDDKSQEDPYAAFMDAIPAYCESQIYDDPNNNNNALLFETPAKNNNNTTDIALETPVQVPPNNNSQRPPLQSIDDNNHSMHEPTPTELDAMTPAEYLRYKTSLTSPAIQPETKSIASAYTLLYRNIPSSHPNLSASKNPKSRAKLANFSFILDKLKVGNQSGAANTPQIRNKHASYSSFKRAKNHGNNNEYRRASMPTMPKLIALSTNAVVRQRAAQKNRMAKLAKATGWWGKLREHEKGAPVADDAPLKLPRFQTPIARRYASYRKNNNVPRHNTTKPHRKAQYAHKSRVHSNRNQLSFDYPSESSSDSELEQLGIYKHAKHDPSSYSFVASQKAIHEMKKNNNYDDDSKEIPQIIKHCKPLKRLKKLPPVLSLTHTIRHKSIRKRKPSPKKAKRRGFKKPRQLKENRVSTSGKSAQHKVDTVATWHRNNRYSGKRKMNFHAEQPNKKRKISMNHNGYRATVPKCGQNIHFNLPDFSTLPTLKDIANNNTISHELPSFTKQQLSKQFGVSSDILNMSFINAGTYTFNDNQSNKNLTRKIIFNEDDAFVDYTADNSYDADAVNQENNDILLHDDWGHIASDQAFDRHLRNAPKSLHQNANNNKNNTVPNEGNAVGKGWKEAYKELLASGCDTQLLTEKWVLNHWRMIVWTLACTERSFAFKLSGIYCNYHNVLRHLQYRYEYEINGGHAGVLSKIYRGDQSAGCYMVLCVSRIIYAASANNMKTTRLYLTDGWYEMEATFLDSYVESLVDGGDIVIGDKLKVCMARREGTNCEALETKAVAVSLQIARNCIRKAEWYKKLGYQAILPNVFRVSLRSIRCNGGNVPYIYGCVAKRYRSQYSIRNGENTKGKIYNLKAKDCANNLLEKKRHSAMIEMRLRIAKKMGLNKFMTEDHYDGGDGGYDHKEISKKMDKLKERVQCEMMNESCLNRQISEFFSCVIHEVGADGVLNADCTELTVWNPSHDISQCMLEGNYVKIYNLNAQNRTHLTSKIAQLSASSRTKFKKIDYFNKENYEKYVLRKYYDFGQNVGVGFEFDMIGCVVKIVNKQEIFVMDLIGDRHELVSIKIHESEYVVHFNDINSIKSCAVYIIENLKYNGYDNNLSLHSTHSYQRTQFLSNASRSNTQFKNAKEFVQSNEGQTQIHIMTNKIDTNIFNL